VVHSRLKALVAIHLAVGTLPVASFLIPADVRFLPLMWAIGAVGVGQLMLLAFWVGMSKIKGLKRMAGALCGTAYLTVWPMITISWPHETAPSGISLAQSYLALFAINSLIVLLFAAVFWLIRRWSTELRQVDTSRESIAPGRFQYSILHILIVMSVVAVVLVLVRNARAADAMSAWHFWQMASMYALMIIAFLINTICAAFAALGAGQVRLRILLVLIVASLLGVAMSLAARHDTLRWWMVPSGMLVTVFPVVIVIGSLLVARSCGYRLVPKATVT